MATIRPTIYVGLGGTGIKAISRTKKMFEDAFGKGNIPKQIAFAAIDFDLAEDPNLPTSMREDFLSINNAASPRQLYQSRHEEGEYQWVFPQNAGYIGSLISDGASQVRTYGRFLTEMIINNIEKRIADCITQVNNIENSTDGLKVDRTGGVDIHIAMSLAGGTGCGSFINVASLLRNKYQNKVKLIGYGVLHSVFRTMDPSTNKTPRVVANAYSAILDLDYLMEATATNPIELTLNGNKTTLTQPLYDEFFVVDNETENGKRVDNIGKLCEVVGTCMYVAGGELGSKVQSGQSNTHWSQGNYNISPKLGWVQGLGACQVVYKGELLGEVYGLKAAIELIRKMQLTSSDIYQEAQRWTEKVQIREDNNTDEGVHDMLINQIYPQEKLTSLKGLSLDINDSPANVKDATAKYIDNFNDFPTDKVIASIFETIVNTMNEDVEGMLKQEAGVGDAKVFLAELKVLCDGYRSEMENERLDLEKKVSGFTEKLYSKTFKEYEDYLNRVFRTRSGKQERLESIEREAKAVKKCKLEGKRREVAYQIFTNLLDVIEGLITRVDIIDQTLTNLKKEYTDSVRAKQTTSESSLVFEYDLSSSERRNMKLDAADVVVATYSQGLTTSLLKLDLVKELDTTIKAYVSGLNRVKTYKETLIVDVIRDLPEADYEKLKQSIAELSSRLLKLNDRGQVCRTRGNQLPTSLLVQNYLVSLYQGVDESGYAVKSRLEEDNNFLRDIKKEFIASDFDSMKQKIVFYRSDMAIIPYCIDSFDEMTIESEYGVLVRDSLQSGSTGFNPHFDMQIFEDMVKRDFKLKPEMQNEAMFYWVCGSLFGWKEITEDMHIMDKDRDGQPLRCDHKEEVTHPKYIRKKAGVYMYWDEAGAPGKDQKWKSMENLKVRDQAYNYFKTMVFPKIKTVLNKMIVDEIKAKGVNAYVLKANNMIAGGIHDYINMVVCDSSNSSTISSQDKGDWAQYLEEWQYIEMHFINSLKNVK